LPYFIKYENNTDPLLVAQNPGFHGTTGPFRVTTDPNPAPLHRIYGKSLNEWGIPTTDVNGPNQVGTMLGQATAAEGIRSGTAQVYIDPIFERKNVSSFHL
jgi:hypothetical protein